MIGGGCPVTAERVIDYRITPTSGPPGTMVEVVLELDLTEDGEGLLESLIEFDCSAVALQPVVAGRAVGAASAASEAGAFTTTVSVPEVDPGPVTVGVATLDGEVLAELPFVVESACSFDASMVESFRVDADWSDDGGSDGVTIDLQADPACSGVRVGFAVLGTPDPTGTGDPNAPTGDDEGDGSGDDEGEALGPLADGEYAFGPAGTSAAFGGVATTLTSSDPIEIAADGSASVTLGLGAAAQGMTDFTAVATLPDNGNVQIAEFGFSRPGAVVAGVERQLDADGSNTDIVVGAIIAGGLATGGGLVLLARRRRGATATDPCLSQREQHERLGDEAAAARVEADEAADRVKELEAELVEARAALEACLTGDHSGTRRSSWVMPAALARRARSNTTDDTDFRERSNPHAPLLATGEQGWYLPDRPSPISGVVVSHRLAQASNATTAAELKDWLTTCDQAYAAHAIADPDGVSVLLPDDYVARHSDGRLVPAGGVDQRSLVVGVVAPAGSLESALEHASMWVAARCDEHDIPLDEVSVDELSVGRAGVAVVGEPPSHDSEGNGHLQFVESFGRTAGRRLVPFAIAGGGGRDAEAAPCEAERRRVNELEDELVAARAEAETAAQRANDLADRAAEARTGLLECEERWAPTEREKPATPLVDPREGEPTDPSGYYLLSHPNSNAPVRENGQPGWYHTTRQSQISGIVVHTAEGRPAVGVAEYFTFNSRPASAHVVLDELVTIPLLPDEFTAFHAAGGNSRGLGIEIAAWAGKWGTIDAELERQLVEEAAKWCGRKAAMYGVPAIRLNAQQWASGQMGFIAHGDLQPDIRTDPGAAFRWDRFLLLVDHYAGRGPHPDGPVEAGEPGDDSAPDGEEGPDDEQTIRGEERRVEDAPADEPGSADEPAGR